MSASSSSMPNNIVFDNDCVSGPSAPLPINSVPSNPDTETLEQDLLSSTPTNTTAGTGAPENQQHAFLSPNNRMTSPIYIPGSSSSPSSMYLNFDAPFPNTGVKSQDKNNIMSLKLKIPTTPSSYHIGTPPDGLSSSLASSIFSESSRIESPPRGYSAYSEVTPLPSPLIPTDATSAIFKAFNGQSPPSANISRASSVRYQRFRSSSLRGSTKPNAVAAAAAASIAAAVANKPSSSSTSSSSYISPGFSGIKLDEEHTFSGSGIADNTTNNNHSPKKDQTKTSPAAAHVFSQHNNSSLSDNQTDYASSNDSNNYKSYNSYNYSASSSSQTLQNRESSPNGPKSHSNRSVSDYVPQPITHFPFVSCRQPSTIPEDSVDNASQEKNNKINIPNDTSNSSGPENNTNNNSNVAATSEVSHASVPLPNDTIHVEKRPGTAKLGALLKAGSISTGHNLGNYNKGRSASSGSPISQPSTIHREVPIVSRHKESNNVSHSSSNFYPQQQQQVQAQVLQAQQEQNKKNESPDEPMSTNATAKSFINKPDSATSPSTVNSTSTDAANTTRNPVIVSPSSAAATSTSAGSSDGTTLGTTKSVSPAISTTTNTTSASTPSNTNTNTNSTNIISTTTNPTDPTTTNQISPTISERVFEAYDANMKKSTWNELKMLGQGAFSRVFLGCPADRYLLPKYQGQSLDFKVAIKIVDIEIEGNHLHSKERMESGLKREIEILKVLQHPSLIRMYAFNIDAQEAMMVLPLCSGGDLFDFITNHRNDMKSGLVRRVFGEVCRAIAYLHTNNVVHRDIKLENVLLNLSIPELVALGEKPEGYQKYPRAIATVTDMGLSRTIDPNDPNLTTRCGSVDYVPPELLMGQPYDGRQTDSWALGVLLYAMMEGRLPFDPPVYSGRQVRGKVAHRIARVEWSWILFKDHHDVESASGNHSDKVSSENVENGTSNVFNPNVGQWDGGMELVEGALQKRDKRLLATDMVNHPWVKGAAPEQLKSSWIDDISHIFK